METTNTGKTVYELVRSGEFTPGYTYTSEAEGDFSIALSTTGLTHSGVWTVIRLVEDEITRTQALLVNTESEVLARIYTSEIDDLRKTSTALRQSL